MKGILEERVLRKLGVRGEREDYEEGILYPRLREEGIDLEPAYKKGNGIIVSDELRKGLGGKLRKKGDCSLEHLLQGLMREQETLLEDIREPFRFFFLDERSGTWLLARSPDEARPLHWSDEGQSLAFGDTAIDVLELKGIHPEPNCLAIPEYLVFQDVAGSNTLLKGVKSVPPGTLLKGRLGAKTVEEKSLWSGWLQGIRREAIGDPREALLGALQAMVSELDGRVGLFLSSGVDSSLIAWGLKELGVEDIEAITVTCPGYRYDEGPQAEALSAELGISWSPIVLEPSRFSSTWKKAISSSLMPMVSTNQIPWWLMCEEAAKRDLVYWFSGEGCDSWTSGGHKEEELRELEEAVSLGPGPLVSKAIRPKAHLLNDPKKIEEILDIPLDVSARFATWSDCLEAIPDGTIRDVALLYHVRTVGRRLLERASMAASAHGVEVKLPFLHRKFLQYAASTPWDKKNQPGRSKSPLKDLCLQALGEDIPSRRKVGFTFPIRTWIRDSSEPFISGLRELLLDSRTLRRPIYRARLLHELDARIKGVLRPSDWLLWSILNLELWLRELETHSRLGWPLPS